MKPLEVRWIIESNVLDYTDRLVEYLRDNSTPFIGQNRLI